MFTGGHCVSEMADASIESQILMYEATRKQELQEQCELFRKLLHSQEKLTELWSQRLDLDRLQQEPG